MASSNTHLAGTSSHNPSRKPSPLAAETIPSSPPKIENSSIQLEGKAGSALHYTYVSPSSVSSPFSTTLLVFLNGLMSTRSSWDPTISAVLSKRRSSDLPYPALLSYDRYGQGDSDRDPSDKEEPPCHGHDVMSAVHDLHQFLLQIWKEHLSISTPAAFPHIVFVCNSIGCAIARLFTQTYPSTVTGLIFLDSIVANSDFQNFWPDPDQPGFDERLLPPGVSADEVRKAREGFRRMFHPSIPNMEGLSRRNLAQLLPEADKPRLEGTGGQGPFLTVVGHDWETFAQQTEEGQLKIPKILTMTYANPMWQKYNEGLTQITTADRGIGPVIAVGCGHFIQKDDPECVAGEVIALLDRITNRADQLKEKEGSP